MFSITELFDSVLLLGAAGPVVGVLMTASLLQRIAGGEQQAFAKCVEQYGGMIWGLARRMSPTPADAEDAAQDVFLQLWKNAGRFDATRGSEAIFIATLTRRTLISRFRGQKRQRMEISIDDVESASVDRGTGDSEASTEAALASQALDVLSADQRRVIDLAVLHGLSQSEIAAQTGMPLGTVKTLMRRGLILVREKLGVHRSAGGRQARS